MMMHLCWPHYLTNIISYSPLIEYWSRILLIIKRLTKAKAVPMAIQNTRNHCAFKSLIIIKTRLITRYNTKWSIRQRDSTETLNRTTRFLFIELFWCKKLTRIEHLIVCMRNSIAPRLDYVQHANKLLAFSAQCCSHCITVVSFSSAIAGILHKSYYSSEPFIGQPTKHMASKSINTINKYILSVWIQFCSIKSWSCRALTHIRNGTQVLRWQSHSQNGHDVTYNCYGILTQQNDCNYLVQSVTQRIPWSSQWIPC